MTSRFQNPARNLIYMGIATLIIMLAIAPSDRFLARASWYYSWNWGEKFFNQNLYEHGIFGLADIVVVIAVATIAAYIVSLTPTSIGERLRPYRAQAGFVLSAGFTMAVSIVHAIKWVTSRTRPHDWFPVNMDAYTHWFEFGNYSLEVGFNRGAFPGGHVATMSVLLAYFYFMPTEGRNKHLRWFFAAAVMILSLVMGWYRMMMATHWLTDNIASMLLSVMVLYGFYHFLHFPNEAIRQKHPWTASVDRRWAGWELMFMVAMLGLLFALATIVVGIRIIFLHSDPSQGLGVFALGCVLSALFAECTSWILFRRSWAGGLFQRG